MIYGHVGEWNMEYKKCEKPGKGVVKKAYGDIQCHAQGFDLYFTSNGETTEGL